MKIKIIKINQKLSDYNGTNKTTGKPYTIYQWNCNVENNGQIETNMVVKTMSSILEKEFAEKEYEVKENIFNGIKSYMVDTQANKQNIFNSFKKQYKISLLTYAKYIDWTYEHAKKIQLKDTSIDFNMLFCNIMNNGKDLIDFEKLENFENNKS